MQTNKLVSVSLPTPFTAEEVTTIGKDKELLTERKAIKLENSLKRNASLLTTGVELVKIIEHRPKVLRNPLKADYFKLYTWRRTSEGSWGQPGKLTVTKSELLERRIPKSGAQLLVEYCTKFMFNKKPKVNKAPKPVRSNKPKPVQSHSSRSRSPPPSKRFKHVSTTPK